MFDDEKIADDNSMTKLANNYALRNMVKVNNLTSQDTINNNIPIWSQYNALINSLSRLSNCVIRRDYREYFANLTTQNQQELQNILSVYPQLDLANSSNPIFNPTPSPSRESSIRTYLVQELQLVLNLLTLYNTETDTTRRNNLFNFINRHIDNIITLISRSSNT